MTALVASAEIDVNLDAVASGPETDDVGELIPVVLVEDPSDKVRFTPDQLMFLDRRVGPVLLGFELARGTMVGGWGQGRRTISTSQGPPWVCRRCESVIGRGSGTERRRKTCLLL